MQKTPQMDDQKALWNGPAGHAWVEAQEILDGMLAPFEDLLVEAVTAGGGSDILDVGCGTGKTTMALRRRVGERGSCTGVDISEPMMELARRREAGQNTGAQFVCADAGAYPFAPASFDRVVSRFGVMFFEDFVAAFTNLRRAAREGAELHVVTWRSAEENPFMTAAERAAAPLLPNVPARRPDGPGQFALADGARVRQVLEQSGWRAVDLRPVDATCTFAERDLVRYLTLLGPVGRVLQDADDQTRARVIGAVRSAFDPYVDGPHIRFTAACWSVTAKA